MRPSPAPQRSGAAPRGTVVVTIAAGRDEHLHRQRIGLAQDPPELHVVVGMGERPCLRRVPGSPPVTVLEVPGRSDGLPLASARNAGATVALDRGAELIIFLDVDCIPGPQLVSRYLAASTTDVAPTPSLLCGPVCYLPPPPPGGYPPRGLDRLASPHPARLAPPAGQVVAESRFELFWSLSFATTAPSWRRLGGFHEGYAGYGAEDTDFAWKAAAAGAGLYWVGGAEAYHQHHPPSRDDPARVAEMVRNARLFRDRHGWWPMEEWLEELSASGLVEFDPGTATLRQLAH